MSRPEQSGQAFRDKKPFKTVERNSVHTGPYIGSVAPSAIQPAPRQSKEHGRDTGIYPFTLKRIAETLRDIQMPELRRIIPFFYTGCYKYSGHPNLPFSEDRTDIISPIFVSDTTSSEKTTDCRGIESRSVTSCSRPSVSAYPVSVSCTLTDLTSTQASPLANRVLSSIFWTIQ